MDYKYSNNMKDRATLSYEINPVHHKTLRDVLQPALVEHAAFVGLNNEQGASTINRVSSLTQMFYLGTGT
jgi:hypothetical protein